MASWLKTPDELAEMITNMSFGGVMEVADCLSEIIKDRQTGISDYDTSDQENIASMLWDWAEGRMEAVEEEKAAKAAAKVTQIAKS